MASRSETARGMSVVYAVIAAVRRYNRLHVTIEQPVPPGTCLFVGNHGFGSITDLNVIATFAALLEAGVRPPLVTLVHQLAWQVGIGALLEPLGCRRASPEAVREAIAQRLSVVVFPGGAEEAGKAFRERNRVNLQGRSGFARIARNAGVPIVPVVTAGAGESLFVISDGRRLARVLGLPRLIRTAVCPISISLPWGLSIGLVGLLPYFPLPTKLQTTVLPAMRPEQHESDQDFARRVERAMQTRMDAMVAGRTVLLG
jgi:1-acyl-sn-glycerol-3-phosphate acyltransferase